MLREGENGNRIPSGCAISGIFSRDGERISGEKVMRSIELMHDRSNGLGGGFAGYGIYPEYRELYALHIFYNDRAAKDDCEKFLEEHFDIADQAKMPVQRNPRITDVPLIWRYFVEPLHTKLAESQLDADEYVARCVIRVNSELAGAYIFSSGKDMGVFKPWASRRTWAVFTGWRGIPATAGRRTGAIRRTRRAGGAARTRSPCWIFPSCTTGRSPPTTRTGAR